ncbi:MAG: hypothetical protein RIS76_237 [Verrucomicrobiota bacterium]|jgi:hypothetical protein
MVSPSKSYSLGERLQIGASLIPPFALLWVAARKGWVGGDHRLYLAGMAGALLVGAALPTVFTSWHRGVSRLQSWIGHFLLAVILAAVFVAVVIPLGLFYRLAGKSFLNSTPESSSSFWHPARPPGSLRDQF